MLDGGYIKVKKKDLLYQNIINYIMDRIESGELKTNDKVPTELELAKMFKVSRITSKRALTELESENIVYRVQGKGTFVKDRKTISTLKKDMRIVSLILTDTSYRGGTINIIKGVEQKLKQEEIMMTVQHANDDPASERDMLLSIRESGISGMIIYPGYFVNNMDLFVRFSYENYPIVLIDRYIEGIHLDNVVSDNFSGMYMATDYLIKHGHRKIAFIGDNFTYYTSVRDRLNGYYRAMEDNGLEIDYNYVYTNFKNVLTLDDIIKKLKEAGLPTAAVMLSDYLAIDFIKSAMNQGIKIPHDISVIGFDDVPSVAENCIVPLTTVRQDFYSIGYKAAELISRKMRSESVNSYENIKVPVKLILRESTDGG